MQKRPRLQATITRTATITVAAALLLAACGAKSDGADSVAATTTTSVTPASTTAPDPTTTTTEPPLQLTANAKLSTAGLGPIRIGMIVEEAERVSGTRLVPDDLGDNFCRYHNPERGPAGVSFMVSDGEIVRVDVFAGPFTTLSGYGIGTTTAELTEAFGDQVRTEPHPYTDGEYVTFIPIDELDLDKRVIWETDVDGVVVAMRAGRVPYVELIEGCA